MSDYTWNILKTALIFAAIGAVLFFCMPAIGSFLGISSITGSAAGQALFFGGFGALSATITPMVDKFFSSSKPAPRTTAETESEYKKPATAAIPGHPKQKEPEAISEYETDLPGPDRFSKAEAARASAKANHPGTNYLQ